MDSVLCISFRLCRGILIAVFALDFELDLALIFLDDMGDILIRQCVDIVAVRLVKCLLPIVLLDEMLWEHGRKIALRDRPHAFSGRIPLPLHIKIGGIDMELVVDPVTMRIAIRVRPRLGAARNIFVLIRCLGEGEVRRVHLHTLPICELYSAAIAEIIFLCTIKTVLALCLLPLTCLILPVDGRGAVIRFLGWVNLKVKVGCLDLRACNLAGAIDSIDDLIVARFRSRECALYIGIAHILRPDIGIGGKGIRRIIAADAVFARHMGGVKRAGIDRPVRRENAVLLQRVNAACIAIVGDGGQQLFLIRVVR